MGVSKKMLVKARKKQKRKPDLFSNSRSFKQTEVKGNKKEIENCIQSDTEDDFENCEEFEKRPRVHKTQKVRNLLPVKHKNKFIYRTEILKDESEEETSETNEFKPKEKHNNNMSFVQEYTVQKKILNDMKQKVALLCTSVIENPENNVIVLKELMSMMTNPSTQLVVSEKKIICFSLLRVFCDILPSYKIRNQENDPKVQLKKATKKLLSYETNLLKYYIKYVHYLFKLMRNIKKKKDKQLSTVQRKSSYEIGLIAVKCLCELLHTKFRFNYFKNIASMIVPVVMGGDDEIVKICCNSFENLFRADKLGEASHDVVRQIVHLIKKKKFSVPLHLLRSFKGLNLKDAILDIPKIDMHKVRKEWEAMSRKQRQQKKKIKDLEKELREAVAHEHVDDVNKFHTLTLNKVFWVYFHILKDCKKLSLISPALEGLASFAHLINLDFFDDLNSVLCGLMEGDTLNDVDKLHGVYTLFTLLAGQAEALRVDPYRMYCHLYQGLLKLSHYTNVEHYILTIKCLEYNIIRKKGKISLNRILAFAKRVSIACLQSPVHGTLALLSILREIILHVKGSDILLDPENAVGNGIYIPELDDPEHCNAQSTALWELHLLKKHYNPFINLYSLHVLNNCPDQGQFSLPHALASTSSVETLNLFRDVAVDNKMDFLENAEEPPKKKFRSNMGLSEFVFEKDMDFNLNWKDVKTVNFL